MTHPTHHPAPVRARRTVGLLATLGVLAALLVAVTPATATATATEPDVTPADTQHGLLKITDKQWYTDRFERFLHADEIRDTSEGFWYASGHYSDDKNPYTRDISWRFQPYGAYCTAAARYVGWNKWTRTYTCLPDHAKLEAYAPGYNAAAQACRETNGADYWEAERVTGVDGEKVWVCSDWVVRPSNAATPVPGSESYTCAPWESKERFNGISGCTVLNRYSWENVTWPKPEVATRTVQVTVRKNAIHTAWQTRTVTRGHLTRRAVATYRGIRFVGTGTAPVRVTRKGGFRAGSMLHSATRQATATRSCIRDSFEFSRSCATNRAAAAARKTATDLATPVAYKAARAQAVRVSNIGAGRAALRSAQTDPVTRAERQAAVKVAVRRAQADLTRKIRARFPHYGRR